MVSNSLDEDGSPAASMRAATLSGFGQGAGPVLSVRFEPPEQAPASRVSASTMNEERRRILAILGVRDTLRGHFAEERASDSESVPAQKFPVARRPPRDRPGAADACLILSSQTRILSAPGARAARRAACLAEEVQRRLGSGRHERLQDLGVGRIGWASISHSGATMHPIMWTTRTFGRRWSGCCAPDHGQPPRSRIVLWQLTSVRRTGERVRPSLSGPRLTMTLCTVAKS